jgi:two-component system, NarL family, invasion response regulator UvrY
MAGNEKGRVSVLLVDDHAVVREGYRRLLEKRGDIAVVGEAESAADAHEQFSKLSPDVVVMDISLPGVSGIEAMRRMLNRTPDTRVLMFSMYEDVIYADRALQAGACGYVTKSSAPDVLVEAVHSVARGKRYISADIAHALTMRQLANDPKAGNSLSTREFEILRLLVRGVPVREIAEAMGLTPKTVANHQSAIKQKLGVENAVQLARVGNELLQGTKRPR